MVWQKKFKGSRERGGAWIYIHPELDRAIVQNHCGVAYNGKSFPSLEAAKEYAESTIKKVEANA